MMLPQLSLPAITRLHGELLGHLAQLDQLGEHVAAAHLAAAIDSLEERIDGPRVEMVRNSKGDPVEAMARGLIARFGEQAADAARRQMQGASGQVLLTWAAIASRIDQIHCRQTISPA
ncbi:hypothetical protein [uncultured Sphingomonas sp.]|uniref:hypothetical protein n=1 Tax=uncultured Sphingomonas sp. TaxID=158754 RepID=UPI002637F3CE|nr:hypothetical protein [uncultured Sphingomonas sp.]